VLSVLHTRQHLPLRRATAFELIRDDDPRDVSSPFEQLTEESFRGLRIPPALHQDVEDVSLLIHRPRQVMALAADGQTHLVQVPCVPWSWTTAAQLIRIELAEFSAPLPDGLIGDGDATGTQQLLNVSVAEAAAGSTARHCA
jgi:hypothetical protein